jgi:hypothetical protein
MNDLFASGNVATLLLLVLAIEGVVLLWLWWRRGQGVPPWPLLAFLGSGAFLALALRAALTGLAWWWVALWLSLALPAHLAWLALAWRRR